VVVRSGQVRYITRPKCETMSHKAVWATYIYLFYLQA
jgi:hypothetical protein